jgi:hypothetical protein
MQKQKQWMLPFDDKAPFAAVWVRLPERCRKEVTEMYARVIANAARQQRCSLSGKERKQDERIEQ